MSERGKSAKPVGKSAKAVKGKLAKAVKGKLAKPECRPAKPQLRPERKPAKPESKSESESEEELSKLLEEHELRPAKWLNLFHREGIYEPNQITPLKGSLEYYRLFSSNANSKEEKALRQLLEIPESTDDDPEVKMEKILDEANLESKVWLPIFKNELGVTSPHALTQVGEESYGMLQQYTQKAWEKKALRKFLLVLDDEETSYKGQRQKHREKLQKRHEESQQMLQELKALQKEGKERQDQEVEKVEKGIREGLQISPDDWISKDTKLEDTIKRLESNIGQMDGILRSREELDDNEILHHASAGLALQGILMTNNLDEQIQSRDTLLKIYGIKLTGPALRSVSKVEQFLSRDKENEFQKSMGKLGYSVSTSAKGGYGGFSAEVGGGYSGSSVYTVTVQRQTNTLYSSTLKYTFVPLASCRFNDSQLLLSDDALKRLKRIDELIESKSETLEDECEQFLDTFGSHASKELHFGGIYWLKSYSKGVEEEYTETAQSLQSHVVTAMASASYGGFAGGSAESNFSTAKGSFDAENKEHVVSKTTWEVTTSGGPPEVTTLPEWKSALAACNSTWDLIDRGTKAVPVWNIIQMDHHNKYFSNTTVLAQSLHQAWQQMKERSAVSSNTKPSQEAEDAAKGMEYIQGWNTDGDMTKCTERLGILLMAKQDLVKRSMNIQAWPDLYLSQATVQKYLRSVMRAKEDSKDTEHIKLLMRQLVKPSDAHLGGDMKVVSDWLYRTYRAEAVVALKCTDIATLETIIESNLKEMGLAKARSDSLYAESPEQQHIKIRATTIVAKAVNYLLNSFKEANQKYEELLLVTLLFPCEYDVTERAFDSHLLSASDLEYLRKEIEVQSKEFNDESPMMLQAHLFNMTVIMYDRQDVDVTKPQVKRHLEYLQNEMKDDIDPNVGRVLSQFQSSWKELQFQLAFLEKGILQEKKQEGSKLLTLLSETETTKPTPRSESTKAPVANIPGGHAQKLLEKLGLLENYQRKLTLRDALLVRQETLGDKQCTSSEMLPYFILQKLMMLDFKCRGVLLQEKATSISLAPTKEPDDDIASFFDDIDDSTPAPNESSSSENAISKVNPMDGLLALLHSSDNFLRQDLMNRLSTCQLAIPFLLPDPITHTLSLSLWAMRTIIKEWKHTDLKTGKSTSEACPIVKYPTPIVSFCRLTSNRSEHSKSKLLNDVISDSTHNHFFHFNCDGGSTKSLLMDGLVELCWYLPAGKPTDPFTQAITFTNLRGDATSYPKQTKFLSRVSFMNFVLLSENNLDEKSIKILQDLAKAPGGIVMMFLDTEFKQREWMTQLVKAIPKDKRSLWKLHGKGAADIKTDVRGIINKTLPSSCSQQEFRTIEHCARIARDNGIDVDEDDPDCDKGRMLASEIREALVKLPASDKDTVLPLQSRRLWHEWASHDKERHRHIKKGAEPIGEYNSKVEEQKHTIRMQQFSIAESLSPVMKVFLSNLLIYEGDVRNYFLQWLKFILDDHSRQKLPKISRRYREVRSQLLELQRKNKSGDPETEAPLREELENLGNKLVHASFGLEHFLREIGQMYEATVNQINAPQMLKEQVNRLPKAAAELLASGYPLELMDGDASHVPLRWVLAVLDKLSEQLQNARLFVLSVLGIQSSGKSTLLNTMFGLRFTVSAGRCTRGAFMQLLPLNESLKKQTNCDYLLIIDTEGLRAPELSLQETKQHDNELAAFVIGLANVTLINIFGETPGDMDDILQRAVHAFIRMEHVGLKPSCQFVHQNAGAVGGAGKGLMGIVNFQDKLNKMTIAAAKEENLEGQYKMFSHVIAFNEEKDVCYFPGLWKGDPPMAPVNPGYSDGAQKLKSDLIEKATVGSHCLVSAFQARIQDLWKAILHEDFIFSFKNTLEITAYNRLDAKYAKWSWEFQRRMLGWQEEAKHTIRSTPQDKLNGLKRTLVKELSKEGAKIRADLQIQIREFFEEDEQRDILAQWQGRTEKRIDEVRIEQEADAKHQYNALISARQSLAKADTMKQSQRDELLSLVKNLASEQERELNDKELEELYEQTWIEWMIKLKTSQKNDPQSKPPVIETSLENSLKEKLKLQNQLLQPKLEKAPLGTRNKPLEEFEIIPYTHINAARHWDAGKFWRGEANIRAELKLAHTEAAARETKRICALAKEYLEGKKKKKENFTPPFCSELLEIVTTAITEAQEEYPDVIFRPDYKVDIALTVSGYALVVFKEMVEDFRKMNDPVEYLEREMKTPFLRLFKSQYYQTAQEVTAAHNLCDLLVKTIEEALMGSLGKKIVEHMKASSGSFATKKALKARILIDLADNNVFDDYAMYLKDAERSVRKWIQIYTKKHCEQEQGGKTRLTQLAESELERLIFLISNTAKEVTHYSPEADIKEWLARFHSNLMKNLSLDLTEMQKVVGEVEDLDNFTQELCKRLADVNIEQEEFKCLSDMEKWDEQPHNILMKSLVGCREQCPFCKEQCEMTNPNHKEKHRVDLHRPQCLGGSRYTKTNKMVLETCNAIVASGESFDYKDKDGKKTIAFKKYQDVHPFWTISADGSLEQSSYWKWFVAKYTRPVADLYNMVPGDISADWNSLEVEEVKKDLKKLYLL